MAVPVRVFLIFLKNGHGRLAHRIYIMGLFLGSELRLSMNPKRSHPPVKFGLVILLMMTKLRPLMAAI
jgi:hypothetical protein